MGFFDNIKDASTHSTASNATDLHYVVLQVTLKEKGYRLHTITTANGGSKGLGGGDRIQATMVFEKIV